MPVGTVRFFNTTKGFGFITPDGGGPDLFVHASAVERAGLPVLAEGQRLSFQVEGDAKGAKAIKLAALSEGAAPDGGSAANATVQAKKLGLTIYHNPDCPLSRNALAAVEEAGYSPRIVDYMKTPFTGEELKSLAARLKLRLIDLARKYEPIYEELGLTEAANDDDLIAAMTAHPVLVNRPILVTDKAARLCRPSAAVKGFLEEIQKSE